MAERLFLTLGSRAAKLWTAGSLPPLFPTTGAWDLEKRGQAPAVQRRTRDRCEGERHDPPWAFANSFSPS